MTDHDENETLLDWAVRRGVERHFKKYARGGAAGDAEEQIEEGVEEEADLENRIHAAFTNDHELELLGRARLLLDDAIHDVLGDGHGEYGEHEAPDEDDDHQLRYEPVPLRGVTPRDGFKIPLRALQQLGRGDWHEAGLTLARLLGPPYYEGSDDPSIVSPETVRELGEGDANAGRRVLQEFVRLLLHQSRTRIEQPDDPARAGR